MTEPKKYYDYRHVECTREEWMKRKQDSIKWQEKERDAEMKRHARKMKKINDRLFELRTEVDNG